MKRPGPVYKKVGRFQGHTSLGRHAATIQGSMRAYESLRNYSDQEMRRAIEENGLLNRSLSSFNKEAREKDSKHEDITPEHILEEIQSRRKK